MLWCMFVPGTMVPRAEGNCLARQPQSLKHRYMDGCLTSVLSNSVLSNRISKLGLSRSTVWRPIYGFMWLHNKSGHGNFAMWTGNVWSSGHGPCVSRYASRLGWCLTGR
jgi:hypothetical protein